jgi:DNA-binding response OmpR family regulator
MTAHPREIFEFDDFTLDPAERLLLLRGQPVRLTPKTFDLLVALVRRRGSLLSKDRLLDEVWAGGLHRRDQSQREHFGAAQVLGPKPGRQIDRRRPQERAKRISSIGPQTE